MLLLESPQNTHRNRTERKRKLKPHIASIPRRANPASYRAYKPYLRHTHDSAKDTEAESEDGSAAGGEERGGVPDGDVVDALFEDEVLG